VFSQSVTEDLLNRFLPQARRQRTGSGATTPDGRGGTDRTLVVAYVRAHHLDETDPREFVLRPARLWQLPVSATLGAGRAPGEVDVPVPLLEDDGLQDPAVPRLAVRLVCVDGRWWLSNHARGSSTIMVSAPGIQEELSAAGPPHPVRRRRAVVTIRSRSQRPDGAAGADVEHRFTLLAPWIPDDLPPARPAGADPTTTGSSTSDLAAGPPWTWTHQRLLAAWVYPDLIGLAGRGQSRTRTARLLLGQSVTGDDPNERILNGLRRNAARELGVSLAGEAGTPRFIAHIVSRRAALSSALAALHAEYDTQHPPSWHPAAEPAPPVPVPPRTTPHQHP
jgi:hypothetical protein